MTNSGGVRQGIAAGDVTFGTIVGVLPFQNSLVDLELTGEELIDCLRSTTGPTSNPWGLRLEILWTASWITFRDGEPAYADLR